jgi:hypothetical protein
MQSMEFLNAGSIHDVPIGRGKPLSWRGSVFAVFRETFGHFYVFEDRLPQHKDGELSFGVIEKGKIKLRDGHTVDLHTGRYDNTDSFVRSYNAWVENGFVLITIGQLASGLV